MSRLVNFCFALLLFVPIMLVVALVCVVVALGDKSSPIFAQTRIGRNEKPFRLFKIRTMHFTTAEVATHLVPVSSVTKIGSILRKFKIDELPQIINVLNGTMNFVGPRPGLASQVELTAARRKYGIFDVMPGITGYAQIRNLDMSDPELLAQVDADYIGQRNSWTDLQIIAKTILGNGRGDKTKVEVFDVNANDPKRGS